MNKHVKNDAIEVKFRDVKDNTEMHDVNVNEVVENKKLPLKMIVSVLQEKAKDALKNKDKLIQLVTKALSFFKKISNISFLKKKFFDIPLLCDMLTDTINGTYKNVPYSSIVITVIALLYTVSPYDLIFDRLPFIGLLDDAAVLNVLLDTIKNDLETYSSWKKDQEIFNTKETD